MKLLNNDWFRLFVLASLVSTVIWLFSCVTSHNSRKEACKDKSQYYHLDKSYVKDLPIVVSKRSDISNGNIVYRLTFTGVSPVSGRPYKITEIVDKQDYDRAILGERYYRVINLMIFSKRKPVSIYLRKELLYSPFPVISGMCRLRSNNTQTKGM